MTTKIEAYNANEYDSWEEARGDGGVVSVDLPDLLVVTDDTVFQIACLTLRVLLSVSSSEWSGVFMKDERNIKIGVSTTNYKRQV